MKGYIKSCRYYYDNGLLKKDPKAYEEIIGSIAKHTDNKPEIIKMSLSYNVREGEIDSKEIQQQLDWWFKHGLVTKHLKVDEVVDNSFVQQALKEMGK
jgi:NitT/TauT family transport system substrate-binding protein